MFSTTTFRWSLIAIASMMFASACSSGGVSGTGSDAIPSGRTVASQSVPVSRQTAYLLVPDYTHEIIVVGPQAVTSGSSGIDVTFTDGRHATYNGSVNQIVKADNSATLTRQPQDGGYCTGTEYYHWTAQATNLQEVLNVGYYYLTLTTAYPSYEIGAYVGTDTTYSGTHNEGPFSYDFGRQPTHYIQPGGPTFTVEVADGSTSDPTQNVTLTVNGFDTVGNTWQSIGYKNGCRRIL